MPDNDLLSRKEVSEQIFHCKPDTADKYYLYQPDFPVFMKGNRRTYPRQEVNQWIHEHTLTNREL